MPRTITPARMARLVAQWQRTNESQAGFARRHHIPSWTFWYWCRKLTRETATSTAHAVPTFVPVEVPAPPSAPSIEVVLRSGDRLHIGADASPTLVHTVLTTLRSAC